MCPLALKNHLACCTGYWDVASWQAWYGEAVVMHGTNTLAGPRWLKWTADTGRASQASLL